MKVLVADVLEQSALDSLLDLGLDVKYEPNTTENMLKEELSDVSILIVRSTKVNSQTIESTNMLRLIIRAGAGFDTIDINKAAEKGIFVCNTPGVNADAVVELAFGHILSCDRFIVSNTNCIKKGEWRKKDFMNCRGLKGRTLGVIGCGNIGKNLIKVCQALQMKVIGWSYMFRKEEADELGIQYAKDILDVAREADVISIHLAYFKDLFYHFIGKSFFDAMKKGAIFVNTSRGEIVDTNSMIEAIKEKQIKVGLDVFEDEPTGSISKFEQSELAELVCSASCHIGASTLQASEQIAIETVGIIEYFINFNEPFHCVN
jgi:D-3-phosphoglycerate dehydrogenase